MPRRSGRPVRADWLHMSNVVFKVTRRRACNTYCTQFYTQTLHNHRWTRTCSRLQPWLARAGTCEWCDVKCQTQNVCRNFLRIFCRSTIKTVWCTSRQKIHKNQLFWRSRSSKVIEFRANQKTVYDFLLVINSNLGLISHRYWDTASYWPKIANFDHPPLI